MIPAMEKAGYPTDYSAGVTVASSTIGMVIPPSIPMLVYAVISSESVGALFMSTAIPGLLIGILQTVVVYFQSEKRGFHPVYTDKMTMRQVWDVFRNSILAIIMPVLIILSIATGIWHRYRVGSVGGCVCSYCGRIVLPRPEAGRFNTFFEEYSGYHRGCHDYCCMRNGIYLGYGYFADSCHRSELYYRPEYACLFDFAHLRFSDSDHRNFPGCHPGAAAAWTHPDSDYAELWHLKNSVRRYYDCWSGH